MSADWARGQRLDAAVDGPEVPRRPTPRPARSARRARSSPKHQGHHLGEAINKARDDVREHCRAAHAVPVDDGDVGAELRRDEGRLVAAQVRYRR